MSPEGTPPSLARDFPRDWGRWGEDDDVGRINLLDPARVLAAAAEIRTGRRYSLALPFADPAGDPTYPDRTPATEHEMIHDASYYSDGRSQPSEGGGQYTEDWFRINAHGTTHMDALGHCFAEDELWNGHPASTTIGGLERASITAIAERGVVGRAILVDIARHKGIDRLEMHTEVTIADIEAALGRQGTEVGPGDTVILRTGNLKLFYEDPDAFYRDFEEPGVTYSAELLDFFRSNDIVGLGTDTMANERPYSEELQASFPLHVLLQRNLGVTFHEALWLEDWAADCAEDGRWSAFYVAAPLRLVGGTAAPMNPIVVK